MLYSASLQLQQFNQRCAGATPLQISFANGILVQLPIFDHVAEHLQDPLPEQSQVAQLFTQLFYVFDIHHTPMTSTINDRWPCLEVLALLNDDPKLAQRI